MNNIARIEIGELTTVGPSDSPFSKKFKLPVTISSPYSIASEAYRILNINLASTNEAKRLKFIAVTSSVPGEGKTTIAANLAITIAQSEKNVILVDADFRKPHLSQVLGVNGGTGLSYVLEHGIDPVLACQNIPDYNLRVLSDGTFSAKQSGFINSGKLKTAFQRLGEVADVVIIDCPPLLGLHHALLLAPIVDGFLLVVGVRKASADFVRHSIEQLEKVNANLIGAVINDVDFYYGRRKYIG